MGGEGIGEEEREQRAKYQSAIIRKWNDNSWRVLLNEKESHAVGKKKRKCAEERERENKSHGLQVN